MKMIYLKPSTIVVYIFNLAVNTSFRSVIHTVLSVSLLANLFCWQNKSTAYLTLYF